MKTRACLEAALLALLAALAGCGLLTSFDGFVGAAGRSPDASGDADAFVDGAATTDGGGSDGAVDGGSGPTHILIYGGRSMTTNGLADVYSTEVAADGSLGAWRSELAPASPLFFRGGVANGHFIGGDDPNGMARNVVMHPAFANGRVSAWAPDPSLLQARWRNAAAFTNGFAYAIAGNGGGDPTSDRIATVEYAREGKDGVLQTFQSTTPIPTGAQNIGALAVDDRVVVLGGLSAGGTSSSSVFVAQQAAGGALGPWSATVPLPRPDQLAKLVRKDNHLFLIGGYSGPNVYTATFSGGAVDAWTPALAPSVAVSEVEAIVVGDYLYLLGGAVGSNTVVTDAVQFAPINSGGTLGAWQAARPLPTPRSFVLAVAY